MDAAACIGCRACITARKNAYASLFVSTKISQYAQLPQGQIENAASCFQIRNDRLRQ